MNWLVAPDRIRQSAVFLSASEGLILQLLKDATHPKFKEIQKILKEPVPDRRAAKRPPRQEQPPVAELQALTSGKDPPSWSPRRRWMPLPSFIHGSPEWCSPPGDPPPWERRRGLASLLDSWSRKCK